MDQDDIRDRRDDSSVKFSRGRNRIDETEEVSDENSSSESGEGETSSNDSDVENKSKSEDSQNTHSSDYCQERKPKDNLEENSQKNSKARCEWKRDYKSSSVEEQDKCIRNKALENNKQCEELFSGSYSWNEKDLCVSDDATETKNLDHGTLIHKSRKKKDENLKAKIIEINTPEGELDFEEEIHEEEEDGETDNEASKEVIDVETKNNGEKSEKVEAEDDGEVSDDDDLEEGEVKESCNRKAQPRPICRFFNKGQCTWGTSCRFVHPGINDKGNYNMFDPPRPVPLGPGNIMLGSGPPPPMMGPGLGPGHLGPPPPMGMMPVPGGADLHPFPPPPPPFIEEPPPPLESAWERGLRHAKELMKRANYRKEQEPDFEEKRLNLSLDINDRFPDYDKENNFYGRSPPRKHGDEVMHYGGYGNVADNFKPLEREAQDFWRGRYENFEIHWSRPEFEYRVNLCLLKSKSPKDRRSQSRGRSHQSYSSESSHSSRSSRFSSYSYSRSSKSSVYSTGRRSPHQRSFSKSRSRSPYSTLPTKPQPEFRPKRQTPPTGPVRQQYRSRPFPTYERKKISQPQLSALPLPLSKEGYDKQKDLQRLRRIKSRSFSASSRSRSRSLSRSSCSPVHTPSQLHSRTYSHSRSISMSSVSSASSKSSQSSVRSEKVQKTLAGPSLPDKRESKLQTEKPASKIPNRETIVKPREIKNKEKLTPSRDGAPCEKKMGKLEIPVRFHDYPSNIVQKLSKDPLKHIGHKQQIKLTLLNKGTTDKISSMPKKEAEKQKIGEKDNTKAPTRVLPSENFQQPNSSRKRLASPRQQSVPSRPNLTKAQLADKKSTSSRREELLKQLKAVEDAIARKRSKLN
ncbi:zinc finger CCCH domain-containing protein 18-like [Limulus polyphemus]|uniref:Zinc finger CCCH domain-containing protein 18-like n=1 Tax=Limulus polyphemus TaxID=6850 RepID=A0ABM1BYN1_LIMPO|nr:zinc finger CCCH domain-containing protein 18-like [Limulus polyphemus]